MVLGIRREREKSAYCVSCIVFCVLCFSELSTKPQNPDECAKARLSSRPESGRLKHRICVQPKGDRICPAPKGNRNVVAVDLSASPDRYSRCAGYRSTCLPVSVLSVPGPKYPWRGRANVWIAARPAPHRVLGPQLFVSTCPLPPRRPDAAFLPRILTTLLVIFLCFSLFLTIRPVQNPHRPACSCFFFPRLENQIPTAGATSPSLRPFLFLSPLAGDVIHAQSRFAKPPAQHSTSPEPCTTTPNLNLEIQPGIRLTARAPASRASLILSLQIPQLRVSAIRLRFWAALFLR